MDNNTAQNGTLQYPDLTQSVGNTSTPVVDTSTSSTTPPVPPPSDEKVLQDLATQIQAMNAPQPDNKSNVVDALAGIPTSTTPPSAAQAPVAEPTPTTTSQIPTVPVTEDVAAQQLIQSVESASPQPAPKEVASLTNIQEATPINNPDDLNKEEPDVDLKGVVENDLQDIIPGEKVPKALVREPKKENLAQPLDTDEAPSTPKESTQKIDELLRYAIQQNASDLHITAGYPPIVRIDGELREVSDSIITPEEAEELILPILSDEKKELLEVNKEIDLAYFHDGEFPGRFRINVYHTMKNVAAAFRLIPTKIRTIDELKLPPIYHQFSQLKQGFILVTGPTGHGKSTTLAAIIEEINTTRFTHVVTIEDPIEYVFDGKKSLIDQREMNEDTHSWPIALRSALRQDPDVILVGEMRDYETIAAAITLAETGHLVFATLHTNNAAQTVDRIIDVFPENQQPQIRLQLSNILEAIVAQRLIPLDKGGRRAVTEIMIANPAVRNLIREAKTHQIDNVIRTSSDIGMVPLEKSLVALVREGVISVQRAQEYAVFPEEVLRLLKS
ncbi:MAG: twitching motility protein [candidate division WS6 bacterium GW2011_GWE1_34_7]|uniref:Twitching motility protein n=1 Tax=candidate division WS6 bacterium GW2011_GWE1_34_7 TaxID=1619093 RepID=A0A0G0BAA5_9BACT|nr:MAG: twitching motility protein [candidate division WS6 bacterium GW2011_GWE1_34_7]